MHPPLFKLFKLDGRRAGKVFLLQLAGKWKRMIVYEDMPHFAAHTTIAAR